ncbi:lipopolysaccharide biosynthesis protein [Thioalkalivibrio sp. K90mix]|uniref:Wzz/FepE/Etk N-terminal domain-containing protein n=1 Tax=Thioalkalivibrio sp. (strain K90mix) TaxID=396595 RepID=UPI000195A544|nr:Wzz/FepE/Etk N-terminal domain-containing protein [Thioalkalivibrio sp. K90mix]ADC72068.1 lipopolysaccharide biosynthesis protein [Thioalkalivibrio sp. K90mix]
MSTKDSSPTSETRTSGDRPDPGNHSRYDDEISLVDLWNVLSRRKWWIAAVTIAVLLLGTLYGFLKTPSYSFQTTIQLGQDDRGNPVEDPNVTVTFLNNVLIPGIWRDLLADSPETRPPEASARYVDGTEYVHLTTSAPMDRKEAVEQLHTLTTRALRQNHVQHIDDIRAELADQRREQELQHAAQLEQLQGDLDSITEHKERATSRLELLTEERALLEEQIDGLHPLREQLDAALADTDQSAAPLWSMMPLTSIVDMRYSAERRLRTELPDHVQEVEQRLSELESSSERIASQMEREQSRHEIAMAALDRREQRVRETVARGSDYALASNTPEGPGRSLFVALSLILGLMLGVFGAFFREFLANVRATEAN